MISRLAFDGYRAFTGNPFQPGPTNVLEIAPLTLVLGRNNSGKTSVLTLAHSLMKTPPPRWAGGLPLTVGGRELGKDFQDLLHDRDFFGQIRLSVTFGRPSNAPATGKAISLALGLRSAVSSEVQALRLSDDGRALRDNTATGPTLELSDTLELDRALCAERSVWLGPLRIPVNPSPSALQTDASAPILGPRGEGTAEALRMDSDLFGAVRLWMAENAKVELRFDESGTEARLQARHGRAWVSISHVGDGIHQLLPVVTLAKARTMYGKTLPLLDAIQQPELHLHDALHPVLADLLLEATAGGVGRMIVETHSEGLLLRLRRRIAETPGFDLSRVAVYFVDEEPAGSVLTRIPVDEFGDVSWWPRGVFFENLDEVQAMSRARRARQGRAAE